MTQSKKRCLSLCASLGILVSTASGALASGEPPVTQKAAGISGGETLAPGGGSNNGGHPSRTVQPIQWCHSSQTLLNRAADKASKKFNAGQKDDAILILKQALEQAAGLKEVLTPEDESEKSPLEKAQGSGANSNEGTLESNDLGPADSLVHLAAQRGLQLLTSLEDAALRPAVEVDIKFRAIYRYVKFIVREVSDTDVVVYPWLKRSQDNLSLSDADQDRFERRFVEYARAQLDWITNSKNSLELNDLHFVEKRKDANLADLGSISLIPLNVYMRVVENVISFVKEDLSRPDSLFRAKYSCTADRLNELWLEVSQFNLHTTLEVVNDREALNDVHGQLLQIMGADSSSRGTGCELNYYPQIVGK